MTPRHGYLLAVLAALVGSALLLIRPEKPDAGSGDGSTSTGRAAPDSTSSRTKGARAGQGGAGGAAASASPEASAAPEGSAAAVLAPANSASPQAVGACPADMILVDGKFCPFVAHRCEQRLGVFLGGVPEDGPPRCGRYANTLLCEGRPSELHFCIDRYEYPNIDGVRPAVWVTYEQAEKACNVEGKTLCDATEWAFACEGRKTWPYPHGLERKAGACNVDRPEAARSDLRSVKAADLPARLARLDGRTSSGARPRCSSPFSVGDTTGNVAEWVHDPDSRAAGLPRSVAGGHFGLGEATCRTKAPRVARGYRDHRVGFRCCSRARDGKPRRRLLPSGVRLSQSRKLL